MVWFNQSLERQSAIQSSLTLLLALATAALVGWRWPLWWVWLLAALGCWLLARLVLNSRRQLLSAFRRASSDIS